MLYAFSQKGTLGAYPRKRMLYVLVQEMGHEYEALLAGEDPHGGD